MNTNGCPVCAGLGRILAIGLTDAPVPVPCPECAGLAITPASADDPPRRLRAYPAREVTMMLLEDRTLPEADAG